MPSGCERLTAGLGSFSLVSVPSTLFVAWRLPGSIARTTICFACFWLRGGMLRAEEKSSMVGKSPASRD